MSDSTPNFDPFSRRNFLKWSGGCSALSSTAILSQLLNLQLTQCAVADSGGAGGDYKALVCVFLLGGIDSFNMVAPHVQSEYDDYAAMRTDLAIPRENLLEIPTDVDSPGRTLGLHPAMTEMQSLYNNGDAAIIANVGSLVFPTTKANISSVKLPLGLFSHSDLVQHWQTSVPQSRSQVTGWGGRMADLLSSSTSSSNDISMNLALGRLNIFQTGTDVVPYVVNNSGATTLSGYTSNNGQDRIYRRVTDQLYPKATDATDPLSQLYSGLLQRTLAKTKRVSIDAAQAFNDATSADTTVEFADNSLSNQLKMVAKAIKGRQAIGHGRQIFFVTAGGWDHHSSLINNQAAQLPDISRALADFYQETVEMGVSECVTTFTASDFARTLGSNGSGSDHAWGGNHFVIGGDVKGGKVYGDYPDTLASGNDLDLGRGRLIPTTSVDEYNAELAMWFGINNSTTMEDVLPNIRNFYSSSASTGPIGFLM